MKLKVLKNVLLSSLQKVNSIVTNRSSYPILNNVLVETKDNKLCLTSTDLDIRVKVEIDANILEEGKITIPAKKFFEIVKELNGDEIYIECKENISDNNNENYNIITIECGNSKFKLLGLSGDDFPPPLETDIVITFSIPQNRLNRILNLITYAVNADDARRALNGILVSVSENNLTCVATDGRRLALVEENIDNFTGTDGDVIIPVKTANELNRLLTKNGEIKIDIGTNLVTFTLNDSTVMTTKLIDDVYPNYKQVIPINFSKKAEVSRESLASAIKRVSLVVSERSFYIKLLFEKDKLILSATSSDVGESIDSIEINYEGSEIISTFNPIFLLDPIQRLDSDKITIKMNDSNTPFAISNENDFLYIVMPMRIN